METLKKERIKELKELEEKLGYVFKKKYVLNRAMTHSSYANQMGLHYIEHNERLEFLGDSVLSLVVSEYIFKKYKNKPEGKLSKIRASIVCESSLYEMAKNIALGQYMLIGKGEEATGGRERVSILADAYEALIAAIYIDGGFESASQFIISQMEEKIESTVKSAHTKDYKSRLQELVQKEQAANIIYEIENEEGPDHDKVFYAKVSLNGKDAGRGRGKSKKEAEQEAAKCALNLLGDMQ